ncbi:MAG: potassium channel family protein [Mycobacteriales bacterium]
MRIVVMGCGRVGSGLSRRLEKLGHDVVVIDQQASAFRRLGPEFNGRAITGMGFDRDTLLEAGIEQADAFAAVSSGDNSNIISARVAREMFGVEHVVARIYDPKRGQVYERLGIPTVRTVRWTIDQLVRTLLPEGLPEDWREPTGTISLRQLTLHQGWIGRTTGRLEEATGARVAYLTRFGEGLLPTAATVLQEGDLVHVLVTDDIADRVAAASSAEPDESN